MKKYTHAWLALKALELLRGCEGRFNEERNKRLSRFLAFISDHPSTFVRGAWFPDTTIKDNVLGGHTWKYRLDPAEGRSVPYRPPSHNSCFRFVASDLEQKVSLDTGTSDLPDRCEALSQAIRDAILITNAVRSGDVVVFNDSQVALLFLMLAHYACDAHVPVHCDDRDLNDPPHVHDDLEAFWEAQVKKYYRVSTKNEQFDLDEDGRLQLNTSAKDYGGSILGKCDAVLGQSAWEDVGRDGGDWRAFLGSTNNNFWDYLVSVCLVSFHMSLLMFPPGQDYGTVRIMETSPYRESVLEYSPHILADAINTVALLWLATWERWELLLKEGVR